VGRISGSGIGLANVRPIVEQHGGTIGLQSREGVGSTFTIRLPQRELSDQQCPVAERDQAFRSRAGRPAA
jgi:signal transduction histidine kinase